MLCDCAPRDLHSFPTRRSSDLFLPCAVSCTVYFPGKASAPEGRRNEARAPFAGGYRKSHTKRCIPASAESFCRSEEHTSELQSLRHLVCRLLLEKKKHIRKTYL